MFVIVVTLGSISIGLCTNASIHNTDGILAFLIGHSVRQQC